MTTTLRPFVSSHRYDWLAAAGGAAASFFFPSPPPELFFFWPPLPAPGAAAAGAPAAAAGDPGASTLGKSASFSTFDPAFSPPHFTLSASGPCAAGPGEKHRVSAERTRIPKG